MNSRTLWILIGILVCYPVSRVLHAQALWNPYQGNPLLSGGPVEPSVIYDSSSNRYKMWFIDPWTGILSAQSEDGIIWDVSYNYALTAGPQGSYDHFIYNVDVLKVGGEYYMYYTASSTGVVTGICLATSADGIQWQKHPNSPVLLAGSPGNWDYPNPTLPHVVEFKGKLLMVYTGVIGAVAVSGVATSTDGVTWEKYSGNPVLLRGGPSSPDEIRACVGGLALRDSLLYLMSFAIDSEGDHTYCLATSADGLHWQKYAGNPILPYPRSGWDSYQLGGGSLLWVNGQFKFWYCGTGGPASSDWDIGLAYLSTEFGVSPMSLDFGWLKIGTTDSMSVAIGGLQVDTVQVTSITSSNPVFGFSAEAMTLGPGESRTLRVSYTATVVGTDTGSITIVSNDQSAPLLRVSLTGNGYEPLESQTSQFSPDMLTRGLWHFNESAGSAVSDTSAFGNVGVAYGTTISAGQFGNGRSFNGFSDYVNVPPSSSLDLDTSSFRIDVWCKTAVKQNGIMLRRGLAPEPGFMISYQEGHLVGMIGDREDSSWPDTLIYVKSDSTYFEDIWHQVTMVRDRSVRKLFLYVDGILAARPADDIFTIPLNDNRPLTIGRWESSVYPYFFIGAIDEVRISSSKLLLAPLGISVQPPKLDFGWARIGKRDSLTLTIRNTGYRDTLRVASITSNNPLFESLTQILTLPPLSSSSIMIRYAPTIAEKDTGTLSIVSNSPDTSVSYISLTGRAYEIKEEPTILKSAVEPATYNKARINWSRSLYDTAGVADPCVQYSIWRQVPGDSLPGSSSQVEDSSSSGVMGATWEFMQTIPAAGFDQYTAVVNAYVDYRVPSTPNVFIVVAHTHDAKVYVSTPDTLIVFPIIDDGVNESANGPRPSFFLLEQNYPNPFNPSTTIRYGLPSKLYVRLEVYTTLGQLVATLVSGEMDAGMHEVRFDASALATGLYIYRIRAGNFVEARKLLLVR
jgi:predicted GH43/DUF377 family glycosyl hydrolase